METRHTPTPWRTAGPAGLTIRATCNGIVVADVEAPDPRERGKDRAEAWDYCKGNAAFIVRACNAHEQLVAALREAIEIIRAIDQADNTCEKRIDVSEFRAALAAAGAA